CFRREVFFPERGKEIFHLSSNPSLHSGQFLFSGKFFSQLLPSFLPLLQDVGRSPLFREFLNLPLHELEFFFHLPYSGRKGIKPSYNNRLLFQGFSNGKPS